MRVELSNQQWAEIADPETLSAGRRRMIEKAATKMLTPDMVAVISENPGLPESQIGAKLAEAGFDIGELSAGMWATDDASILAFVTTWSYGDVISEEVLMDLPGPDYDELKVTVEPLVGKLRLDTGPSMDRESPTPPLDA